MSICKHSLATIVAILSLIFILTPYISASPKKKIELVKEELIGYFNPLEGKITSVDKGEVTINIGEQNGVKRGMRFLTFKIGEPFYHPVTGEQLGNVEIKTGCIEVLDVFGDHAVAKILDGSPSVDDIVRISSGKIKIAFFQKPNADWRVAESLYKLLKNSGRFELLDAYVPSYDPHVLTKISSKLGAEAFILLSTKREGDNIEMSVKVFYASNGSELVDIKKVINPYEEGLVSDREIICMEGDVEEPWSYYKLPLNCQISYS
ncbi:MAG: hypothetical protein D6828_05420, partial [Nitrospirae bacterium]